MKTAPFSTAIWKCIRNHGKKQKRKLWEWALGKLNLHGGLLNMGYRLFLCMKPGNFRAVAWLPFHLRKASVFGYGLKHFLKSKTNYGSIAITIPSFSVLIYYSATVALLMEAKKKKPPHLASQSPRASFPFLILGQCFDLIWGAEIGEGIWAWWFDLGEKFCHL